MLRRVLVMGAPVGGVLCAVPVVKKDEKTDEKPSLICKPSDLPIYSSLVDDRWVMLL